MHRRESDDIEGCPREGEGEEHDGKHRVLQEETRLNVSYRIGVYFEDSVFKAREGDDGGSRERGALVRVGFYMFVWLDAVFLLDRAAFGTSTAFLGKSLRTGRVAEDK